MFIFFTVSNNFIKLIIGVGYHHLKKILSNIMKSNDTAIVSLSFAINVNDYFILFSLSNNFQR